MARTRWMALAVGLVGGLAACNPSVVAPEAPVFQKTVAQGAAMTVDHATGHAFFLATPLSGPEWRNPNAFGEGPVLATGSLVVIEAVESTPATEFDYGVITFTPTDRRFELGQIYRIRFRTEGGVCADGCQTHWRLPDDDAFVDRFQRVFAESDPLAALSPEDRELVAAHKVASWFDADLITLSLGLPNVAVTQGRDATWVYEARSCTLGRLQAVPSLALWLEAGQVTDFERLPNTDFYYVAEPKDDLNGLCPQPVRYRYLTDTPDPTRSLFGYASLDRFIREGGRPE